MVNIFVVDIYMWFFKNLKIKVILVERVIIRFIILMFLIYVILWVKIFKLIYIFFILIVIYREGFRIEMKVLEVDF